MSPGGERLESRTNVVLLAAAFVIAIFLAYQPAWRAEFIWDDDAHLTAHKCIVGPLGFKEIWTTSEAHYFPLVLTTWWVVKQVFGLDPMVFHLLGIALHAAAALLLWRVLSQLRVRGALLGAGLWAFHPVQVESVAWISETINTQSGVFFLLSLSFAIRWLERGENARRRDYVLACVFGLAAILSKPSTVMLPVALALCCWWRRGTLRIRDGVWLLPFFVMAAAASGWTILEQSVYRGASGEAWSQSFPERIIVAGRVVWFYLGKLLWPAELSFIYPRWTPEAGNVFSYFPGALAALGAACLFWRREKLRGLAFAAGYYVALLFPVLGFFSVYFFRYSFVADHFQYLASMGPLALAGAGIATLHARAACAGWRRSVAVAATASVALFAVISWREAREYRNNETLWRATLRTNPAAYLAHNNLGVMLVEAGKPEQALAHYHTSLALDPKLAETHFNLGKALSRMGRTDEAIAAYETSLRLNPRLEQAHLALANVLVSLPGRRTDAIAHYETTLKLNPNNADAHSNLSTLLGDVPARFDDAVKHAETAVRLKPDAASAHLNLGVLLARIPGRVADAIAHYETALRLKPDYVKVHINLGLALAAGGRIDDAIQAYRAALGHDPNSAVAHNNLGVALAQQGKWSEAVAHFENAVRLDPNFADARANLAAVKARLNSTPPPE